MNAPTIDDLRQWPPTVPLWPDAAGALGLSRTTAYELVRRGELPVRTLRLGRLLRVPTAELLAVLGIPLMQDAGPEVDA
jgi:excisionase family DNA binding protein